MVSITDCFDETCHPGQYLRRPVSELSAKKGTIERRESCDCPFSYLLRIRENIRLAHSDCQPHAGEKFLPRPRGRPRIVDRADAVKVKDGFESLIDLREIQIFRVDADVTLPREGGQTGPK